MLKMHIKNCHKWPSIHPVLLPHSQQKETMKRLQTWAQRYITSMSPFSHDNSLVKEKLLKLNPIDYIRNTEDPFVDWEPTVQWVSWIKYMYFTKDDQNMYCPNMDTDTVDNLRWHKRLIKITIQDQNQAHTESIE